MTKLLLLTLSVFITVSVFSQNLYKIKKSDLAKIETQNKVKKYYQNDNFLIVSLQQKAFTYKYFSDEHYETEIY